MTLSPFPAHRPPETARDAIWIFRELPYGYLGLNIDDRPTAIYPVRGRLPVIGRGSGALRTDYRAGVRIHVGTFEAQRDCCVVTCSDWTLNRSFGALAEALAAELASATEVTAQTFGRALATWERLFLKRRRLSLEEEQGLWGELHFLSRCPSLERAIAAWRGPNAEDYDFLANGVAFEVKTSTGRGRHHVSHAQVSQAIQAGSIYLISLWAGIDEVGGTTLPQLVDALTERTRDPIGFEERLLSTGFSRADAAMYDRPFTCLEAPVLYDMATVPRVREMDPGVQSLSYKVQLDGTAAVPEEEKESILTKAFG
jgi:Putative  PD-(D/E)XK family member, (DUF4420)